MQQHPIPQNISSYQFRLVGDMTLKQFFQLAGGLVAALIFYSSPLLPIIKWPFAIVSAILGVALAFLPLEERPLERWIFAFFRAIYSPTEYFWKKALVAPKFFQDEGPLGEEAPALKEYLGTPTAKTGPLSKLESAEQGFLASIAGIFSGVAKQAAVTPQPEKPKEISIPESVPVKYSQPVAPHLVVEEKPILTSNQPQITTSQVAPIVAGEELISTRQALFSIDAAPPNPPTIPNVIVGQVVDHERKIVEGAIMEIKDAMSRPIRALRSNKVGHFITVTPLDNGHYEISTEKEGYEFSPVSFDANGTLIPPILVQGRRVGPVVEEPAVIVKPKYSIN